MNPTDVPLNAAVLQLIADAKGESARLRHEYIGTEHLVLALSRQAGDAAPLAALAVEPQRVYTLISETVRRGRVALEPEIERPLTSRTKRAFSLAAESARQLGHTHIGVADLLVGLLRERLNIGAQVWHTRASLRSVPTSMRSRAVRRGVDATANTIIPPSNAPYRLCCECLDEHRRI